jgi:hypothetical protein
MIRFFCKDKIPKPCWYSKFRWRILSAITLSFNRGVPETLEKVQ